jgi:hypothetical protein
MRKYRIFHRIINNNSIIEWYRWLVPIKNIASFRLKYWEISQILPFNYNEISNSSPILRRFFQYKEYKIEDIVGFYTKRYRGKDVNYDAFSICIFKKKFHNLTQRHEKNPIEPMVEKANQWLWKYINPHPDFMRNQNQ